MMTSPVDWQNACDRAVALREAYYSLLSGTQAYHLVYSANGVQREVTYSVIDMNRLASEIRVAERECGNAAARGLGVANIRSEKGWL
jgi:hypothetical protein